MKKLILLMIVCPCCFFLKAQPVVSPGHFRCISSNGPVMNYWKDPSVARNFTNDLDSLLLRYTGYRLPLNTVIAFTPFNNKGKDLPEAGATDAFPRINANLIEYSTGGFLKQFNLELTDSAFLTDVVSVFRLQVSIQKNSMDFLLNRSLDIFIKRSPSSGMGVPIENVPVTAKGFTEVLGKSLNFLLDSTNRYEEIELRVSPPFLGDNFILEKTAGLPRTMVDSKNKMSRFTYATQQQIIRWGEQEYRDILLKGKNKTPLNDSILAAFEEVKASSDFVFLQQECRDVVADKNYLLKFPVRILTGAGASDSEARISLLPGNFHTMLSGIDTIALFSVKKNIADPDKKLFLHQVSNGLSAASLSNISENESILPVEYDFIIEGKISNSPFGIFISSGGLIKEFLWEGKLICIALGHKAPERFVTFGQDLSAVQLNALLLIGFNSFFQ